MIRTVTIYTGESDYAKAAQKHGMEIARLFGARLKIAGIWSNQTDSEQNVTPESSEGITGTQQEELIDTAQKSGINAEAVFRGEGLTEGLLEEAKETDLLVLGLATEEENEDKNTDRLVNAELPVLRRADSHLLIVNRKPSRTKTILAKYEPRNRGKAMLRMVGAMAEKYGARIDLLTTESRIADAVKTAESAVEYLKGYQPADVKTHARTGSNEYSNDIISAAESCGADLIAMGEEGHNWLERLMGTNTAERTALETSTPLLIAR